MKYTISERLAAFEDSARGKTEAGRFASERGRTASRLRHNGGTTPDYNHVHAAAAPSRRGGVDAYLEGVREGAPYYRRELTNEEVADRVAADAYDGRRRLIRRSVGAVAATAAAVGLYLSPQIAHGIDGLKGQPSVIHVHNNPHAHDQGMEQPMVIQRQPSPSGLPQLPQHHGPEA